MNLPTGWGVIADTMLDLFERINSEAPAAGDEPADRHHTNG